MQSQLLEKVQEICNLQDKVSDLLILTTAKTVPREEGTRQKTQVTQDWHRQKMTIVPQIELIYY